MSKLARGAITTKLARCHYTAMAINPTTEGATMPDYYGWDEEVPAGYQDADLEQAEYEAQGRELAAQRRRGICSHGWQQGLPDDGSWPNKEQLLRDRAQGYFPTRPTNTARPEPGMALCLECGEHVPDMRPGR